MAVSEKRREYLIQYRAHNLKRIPLDVKPALYEQIKAAADKDGVSVNAWIRRAIGVYLSKKK